MSKPAVYYRAALAAYVCVFIAGCLGGGAIIGSEPFFNITADIVIAILALVVGAWQHALRYKYNPKEGEL
jgi:hypothetical protein